MSSSTLLRSTSGSTIASARAHADPTPTVSIVMPCFNSVSRLERSLQSVFAQGMGDWELVVADDGSTDTTLETRESYAQR